MQIRDLIKQLQRFDETAEIKVLTTIVLDDDDSEAHPLDFDLVRQSFSGKIFIIPYE